MNEAVSKVRELLIAAGGTLRQLYYRRIEPFCAQAAKYDHIDRTPLKTRVLLYPIQSLAALPVLLYTLYFLFGIIYASFKNASIPNEYREAANVLLTNAFREGNNPYALSSLSGEQPGMIYLYGPLYSILVCALSFLIPCGIVTIHYVATLIFMFLSAFLGSRIVWERSKSVLPALLAFLFMFNCHWRYNYVNAVPDSMALCLMVLMLFILSRDSLKHKFLPLSILTLAIFFTKQYFLLIAGTVFIYLFLFDSAKEAFKYCITTGILFIAAGIAIQAACPLFWTYNFYMAKGPGSGIAHNVTKNGIKVSSESYNFQQVMSIGGLFLMLFITETGGCLMAFLEPLIKKIRLPERLRLFLRLPEPNPYERLFRLTKTDILMLIHLGVSGLCLTFYLGKNGGAWLSYYLELFIPALIIGSMLMLEKGIKATAEPIFWKRTAYAAYLMVLILFTLSRTDTRLQKNPLSDEDYKAWEAAENLLKEYGGNQYLYPIFAYFGLKERAYIYNTGQPFVVSEKFYRRYKKSFLDQKLFPYADKIFSSHLSYREKMRQFMLDGEYSLITRIDGKDQVFEREDLQKRYRMIRALDLRTGRQVWRVEFWIRKESPLSGVKGDWI